MSADAADDAGTTNEDAILGNGLSEKLSSVAREVESLVRASDMFKSLTIGAADGIDKQAERRKSLADTMQPKGFATEKLGPAARIENEVAALLRFAKWLRKLSGE